MLFLPFFIFFRTFAKYKMIGKDEIQTIIRQIKFMSNGKADITMAKQRDTEWYTETYDYAYYGSTLRFSRKGNNISLQGIYYEGNDVSAVRGITANAKGHNGEVEEVARYNLSGHPCKPYDKGVQIVVYSDYTTKTIIFE